MVYKGKKKVFLGLLTIILFLWKPSAASTLKSNIITNAAQIEGCGSCHQMIYSFGAKKCDDVYRCQYDDNE